MAKYKEVSAKTRQNIMDAFWQIYCKKRIEKITVREITTKAGYNRGTFYEYFADVYDVLEQIEQSLLPDIEELPPITLESVDSAQSIDLFIKLYSHSSAYYTVLLGDNGDPAFAAKIKKGIKTKLKAHLGESGGMDLVLDYTLEYMLSAMIGILTHWFQSGENMPKEDLLKLIYKLMDSEEIRKLVLNNKRYDCELK